MVKLAFSKPTRDAEGQRLLFDRYQQAGYDGLQLKGNQYSPYLDDPARFQAEWGSDPAHVSSLITMNPLDEDGKERLRTLFRFAAAVGSERVVLCHDVPRVGLTDDDLADIARMMSGLGQEASDQGVRLSLHHHTNEPVMHRRDFDVFFDAVQDKAVSLTVDTGHLMKSEVLDIAGLIRDLAPVIDNVHLKDYEDGQFRLLGQGTVEFGDIIDALTTLDASATLCVDEESRAEIFEGMEVSQRFLEGRLVAR
ncbi:sugar phosphate isomerase/epimerase family protein [Actinopolymorpha pittospori]|uniref:Sugar phosphate isomerase/epimerase n=1 Tax=Actinopolymorpha pittospori TaxID=648752 RepID=A0A927RL41_9ACTN|nr:sugar phosphate isomerase/epimerase [Actinopolymorpha pittospori]MBE1607383.1 sugar phosphate isomerase/epimerase [Actinopolymorpha pittospori]